MTVGRLVEAWRLALAVPGSAAGEVSATRGPARFAVLVTPIVGAVFATAAAGVMLLARHVYAGPTVYIDVVRVEYLEAPILAAALALAVVGLCTRGRQLGGLARAVEPVGAPAAAGAVSPVGAVGVAALVGCVLLEVLALASSVLAHHGTQSLVFGVVTGRLAVVWACTPHTSPAPDDDAGSAYARTVPWAVAVLWTVAICAGAAVYGRYDSEVGSPHGALRGVVAVLVAVVVSWAVKWRLVKRDGGVSGASLGAVCEIATLVSLLVTAAGRP